MEANQNLPAPSCQAVGRAVESVAMLKPMHQLANDQALLLFGYIAWKLPAKEDMAKNPMYPIQVCVFA